MKVVVVHNALFSESPLILDTLVLVNLDKIMISDWGVDPIVVTNRIDHMERSIVTKEHPISKISLRMGTPAALAILTNSDTGIPSLAIYI